MDLYIPFPDYREIMGWSGPDERAARKLSGAQVVTARLRGHGAGSPAAVEIQSLLTWLDRFLVAGLDATTSAALIAASRPL